jgi:blue copper oxidase
VSFRIQSRDGREPPPWERGWKDVVLIRRGESVRLAMTFTQPASKAFPFMYHCHMLEHEDNGMMGQFTVVRS